MGIGFKAGIVGGLALLAALTFRPDEASSAGASTPASAPPPVVLVGVDENGAPEVAVPGVSVTRTGDGRYLVHAPDRDVDLHEWTEPVTVQLVPTGADTVELRFLAESGEQVDTRFTLLLR